MQTIDFTENSEIKGVCIVAQDPFKDNRGENWEGYNEEYNEIFCKNSPEWWMSSQKFIVDSYSHSKQGVLRGFHGDTKTWKLISCLQGAIYFVLIDRRPASPTFDKFQVFGLSEGGHKSILVPPGVVNAHLCLSDECLFHYKLTHKYVPQEEQLHVKWNDPKYAINWPPITPILSQRDS